MNIKLKALEQKANDAYRELIIAQEHVRQLRKISEKADAEYEAELKEARGDKRKTETSV